MFGFHFNIFIMSQDYLIIINIIITLIVGGVLLSQIRAQKTIIDKYKDFANVIDPKKALSLKDVEIEQIKKNMSNDIQTLQNQVSELSSYVNYIIQYGEETSQEINYTFDVDAFITNNFPSCRNVLNS